MARDRGEQVTDFWLQMNHLNRLADSLSPCAMSKKMIITTSYLKNKFRHLLENIKYTVDGLNK
jgi:hypothetical protein